MKLTQIITLLRNSTQHSERELAGVAPFHDYVRDENFLSESLATVRFTKVTL